MTVAVVEWAEVPEGSTEAGIEVLSGLVVSDSLEAVRSVVLALKGLAFVELDIVNQVAGIDPEKVGLQLQHLAVEVELGNNPVTV